MKISAIVFSAFENKIFKFNLFFFLILLYFCAKSMNFIFHFLFLCEYQNNVSLNAIEIRLAMKIFFNCELRSFFHIFCIFQFGFFMCNCCCYSAIRHAEYICKGLHTNILYQNVSISIFALPPQFHHIHLRVYST